MELFITKRKYSRNTSILFNLHSIDHLMNDIVQKAPKLLKNKIKKWREYGR